MLEMARTGRVLMMGARKDGWLRTAAPLKPGGPHAWALEDGAALGLKRLLARVEVESVRGLTGGGAIAG